MSVQRDRDLVFRKPSAADGQALHILVRECAPLDENSLYCNLLQCHMWADTSIVAVLDDQLVGAVTGFRKPDDPRTVFIWQVAVHPRRRGCGLGQHMLSELVTRLGSSR
jgi:Acetyltransferases